MTSTPTSLEVFSPDHSLDQSVSQCERMDQGVVLEAGQYWRHTQLEGSSAVRLVTEVRYVQDKAHTVVVAPHPEEKSVLPVSYYIEDFFSLFVFEPCGELIRQQEIAMLQTKVVQLQAELMDLNNSPEKLEALAQQEFEKESGQKIGLVPLSFIESPDLKSIDENKIAQMKNSINYIVDINNVKTKIITGKIDSISEIINAIAPFYQEIANVSLAKTSEVRKYVDKLLEGVESLNLYLGKNVIIERITEGENASYEEPLVILQRKLAMDEELCLFTDVNEQVDASDDKEFVRLLQTEVAFVDQIFTRPRAVVLMLTTRRQIEYSENLFENTFRNEQNKQVFLLIRNGENVFRVYSPIFSHEKAHRLFPSRDEQEAIFKTNEFFFDGTNYVKKIKEVEYKNTAFSRCMEKHDQMVLHYKRFLLLLAGLDLQQSILGEFHPQDINFVSVHFQKKYMHFVFDDEGGDSLLGHSYTESLEAFFYKHNKDIISGKDESRIACNLPEMIDKYSAPGAFSKGEPRYPIATPVDKFGVFFVRELDGQKYIDVPMEKIDKRSQNFTKNILCKVFLKESDFEQRKNSFPAFIRFDAIDREELQYHLNNRGQRTFHLNYIRLFKYVEKYLCDRDTQFEKLCTTLNIDEQEQKNLCKQLFLAWGASRKYDYSQEDSLACAAQIRAQLSVLQDEGKALQKRVEATLKKQDGEALQFLSLSGKGDVIAYASLSPEKKDNRFEPDPRLMRYILKEKKRSMSIFYKDEVAFPFLDIKEVFLPMNKEKVKSFIESSKEKCNGFYTMKSIKNKTYTIKKHFFDSDFAELANPEVFTSLFEWLLHEYKQSSAKYIEPKVLYWPLHFYTKNNEKRLLCVSLHDSLYALYFMEKDKAKKEIVKKKFTSLFFSKTTALQIFDEKIKAIESRGYLFKIESISITALMKILEKDRTAFNYRGMIYPFICTRGESFVKDQSFRIEDHFSDRESIFACVQNFKQFEEMSGAIFSDSFTKGNIDTFLCNKVSAMEELVPIEITETYRNPLNHGCDDSDFNKQVKKFYLKRKNDEQEKTDLNDFSVYTEESVAKFQKRLKQYRQMVSKGKSILLSLEAVIVTK